MNTHELYEYTNAILTYMRDNDGVHSFQEMYSNLPEYLQVYPPIKASMVYLYDEGYLLEFDEGDSDEKQYLISAKGVLFIDAGGFKMTSKEPESKIEPTIEKGNPYPFIFKDAKSFRIFEFLHSQYKDSKTPLADYSFIYWKMYNDGFIIEHFRPEMFRNWILKPPFEIDTVHKLRTLDVCKTQHKLNAYNSAKLSVD